MASWKRSLKLAYKSSPPNYVTLSDSPTKDSSGRSEDLEFEANESVSSDGVHGEQSRLHSSGAVAKTAKNHQHQDHSLPPIELNCFLKLKETTIHSSDDNNDIVEEEYELVPHLPISEHSKNFSKRQQSISKDMLCTVVKDMELSSRDSHSDDMLNSDENFVANIFQDLSEHNVEAKCVDILNFAKRCLSEEFYSQLDEADILSVILRTWPNIQAYNDFTFCCTVLLCVLSQYPKDRKNMRLMESVLITFLQTTTNRRRADALPIAGNGIGEYDMKSLPENIMKKSKELCVLMSVCNDWELQEINVAFLNYVSIKNIFAPSNGGIRSNNQEILCCVMDKIHEGVQQLSLKKRVCFAETCMYHNLRMLCKCLQILEEASLLHTENQKYLISCQNSAISRNSNRLLGFCLKYLYCDATPQCLDAQMPEDDISYDKEVQFYLRSCLVSILKVLLNFSFNCKEAVIKLGAIDGLMEKLVICTLNVGSQKSEGWFEILILCLELLINLIESSWANRKTFALLCLKKLSVSAESPVFAVEQLIDILTESLNEISRLELLKDEATKDAGAPAKTDEAVQIDKDAEADIVFKAAGKDMEQSMICAYISILLGFFVDIKRTFRDLVHDKMPREIVEQAVLVSKKFLRFVALTEGTPRNSIKSMSVMLSTLQSVHDGR